MLSRKKGTCLPMFLLPLVITACPRVARAHGFGAAAPPPPSCALDEVAGALAALADWQRVSPLQARGWPRGAEKQSTVFSSGTSHFPLGILLSPEPHGTPATAQNPSSDAERGRAFTLTRGLGFAHQGPASTGTRGRCGRLPLNIPPASPVLSICVNH